VRSGWSQARFHPLFHDVLRDLAARELTPAEGSVRSGARPSPTPKRAMPARALAALAASGAGREAVAGFERAWAANEHDGALAALAHGWPRRGRAAIRGGLAGRPPVRARADADAGGFTEAATGAAAAAEAWLARGRLLAAARVGAFVHRSRSRPAGCARGFATASGSRAARGSQPGRGRVVVLAWLGRCGCTRAIPRRRAAISDRALATLPERAGRRARGGGDAPRHVEVEFTGADGRTTSAAHGGRSSNSAGSVTGGARTRLLVNMAEADILPR
jgi:hypothetical protein